MHTPAAVALDGVEGPITYRVLHNRVLRLAYALRASGVTRGQFVATCVEPCVDTVVAFLAVLSLGAAYCPLDPRHPTSRHEFTLTDADPSVVITTTALLDRLPPTQRKTLFLDDPAIFETPMTDPPTAVSADAPACILYTSGSTGKPKGAIIPHRGIIRLIFGMPDAGLDGESRVLLHSPLAFDISTFEIFGPLLHGGTCVIFPGGRVPTLHELKTTIRTYGVTCLFFGPAPANMIIDEEPDVLTGLRTLILGGEAMSAPHARKCLALHPSIRLVNGYGPTEATTFCSSYLVRADFPADAKSVPIGKPLAKTQLYIVDEQNHPITDDTPGELLVGGDGVALGYLNRPELTAEKFIPNTFDQKSPGMPLYRTGDLCRHLPDGNIDYIGRMDHQIKLNGHRIELGEIETAISMFPGISQSVVMAREDGGDRRLVAYYTTLPSAAASPDQLRSHLSARLPAYMVPIWLIPLDLMPVTPSGKVDRRALPAPRVDSTAPTQKSPATEFERELLALWRQVLGSDRVGMNDDYFDAGGTSLGAMRLCALIERHTGTFVPVSTLSAAPTPAKMALAIRDKSATTSLSLPLSAGPGPGLFCVPGLSGHSINFRSLASHFDGAIPVYGLNFPGLDGISSPAESVEEMAKILGAEIRRFQPAGPYNLLGYSFGGAVAFEIAQQFSRDGHAVDSLILVEAFTHESFRTRRWPERLLVHGRHMLRNGVAYPFRRFRRRSETDPTRFQSTAASTDLVGGKALESIQQVDALNEASLRRYRPAPYAGEVTCVMGDECPEWAEFYVIDPTGGWRTHVRGPFHMRRVAGNHLNILHNPNVAGVAAVVRDCLESAEVRA